jgi:hypothetical protein
MRASHVLLPLPIVCLSTAVLASCVSTSNESTGSNGSSLSCPEFEVGGNFDANADVDAHVRAFMQASADLGKIAAALKPAVKTACIGVATDLGAPDSWTALGDSDDAIGNSGGTGACDVARARAQAIMQGNATANFALVVTRGACYPDFTAEASCEAGCKAQEQCDPGTVETRCDPAHLNVTCQGSCAAKAFCEGTTEVEATCEGSCEAECHGHCSATCTDEAGHRTDDDPSCHGKCNGHCSGTCTGRCQIDVEAGVQCGANVTCTGGCTGSYTNPRCQTEFTPPKCTIDETCFERCRADVVASAKCDPDTVKLLADVTVSGDVAKLAATVEKNLPPLFQAAEAQGHIAVDIVQNVVSSGQAVLTASGSLDVHSAACAAAAAQSLTQSASTLTVSVQGGAGVSGECAANAQ